MMWGWGAPMAAGWGWFGMLFMWLVPLAVIGLVAWALLGARRPAAGDDAQAILKRRLANGEISEEEYRRLRDLLK